MSVAPFLLKMTGTTNIYCREIIELIIKHGVKKAYCSPGSRNAPLLIALSSCQGVKKRVVVDERSSAFQALGCALIEREPVLLVCTSGTAVLNYAPAVAEAYYSGVPLIIVSADRPREWIDQDDSQTIRQYGVLDHIVKGSYDLRAIPEGKGKEFTKEVLWTVNRTINEAMLKALDGKPGPVHINVQLADPLGEIEEKDIQSPRIVTNLHTKETLPQEIIKELATEVAKSKVMLVAGYGLPDDKLNRAVRKLASLPNVVVMAETISNLYEPQRNSSLIDAALCEMSASEKERMRPDIVISIGGALVSRMFKQYLRDNPPGRHWSVGHSNYFCDCFMSLTERIDISPAYFLNQLYGAVRKSGSVTSSGYFGQWQSIRERAAKASQAYIEKSRWSDLKAYDYILRNYKFDNLFVSNGTSIRYSQLIPHSCHAEYCNRGVSGIDGSTSTAVGGAESYAGNTVLLTGDMSFLYDSGASVLGKIPGDMRIIVIDNDGGGIFRFIKSTANIPDPIQNEYFCVGNHLDIESIALGYGIDVAIAEDFHELKSGLKWLQEYDGSPRLLIVRTPAETSAEVLKGYFDKR